MINSLISKRNGKIIGIWVEEARDAVFIPHYNIYDVLDFVECLSKIEGTLGIGDLLFSKESNEMFTIDDGMESVIIGPEDINDFTTILKKAL